MANETTETGIRQKGEYKHPDFPERSLERLMADGAKCAKSHVEPAIEYNCTPDEYTRTGIVQGDCD